MFGPRVPSVGTRTDIYANGEPMNDRIGRSQDLVLSKHASMRRRESHVQSVGLVVNPS